MNRSVIILVALPLAIAILSALIFSGWYVIHVEDTEMVVNVTNSSLIGFNAATDKLYFGTVVPGGGSQRFVLVSSAVPSRVVVQLSGPLSEWVTVSEYELRLDGRQSETLHFTLMAPKDAPVGQYKGSVRTAYYRILPWQ